MTTAEDTPTGSPGSGGKPGAGPGVDDALTAPPVPGTEAEPPGPADGDRTDGDEAGTADPEADDAEADESAAVGLRPRRRRLVWPALGAAAIAAGVGAWLWAANDSDGSSTAATGPVATAVVERGTISATQTWEATLEPGERSTVTASGQGTITRLAEPGQAVKPGDELYRLNEQPVVLLDGKVPMFRDLAPGDTGADAEQMTANLQALGYGGFTADAVRAWQQDIGAAPTGVVSSTQVVFLPQARRVDTLHVGVGDRVSPGAPVVDVTGTKQVVSLEVPTDDRDRLDGGTKVTVVLPDGNELPGTVGTAAVLEPAAAPGQGPEADAQESEAMVQVEVALDENAPNELVGSPVEVVVATDERSDVLLVPVNALLALSEGGFGLEVVGDDGTRQIVAVDTGLFANGKVEVSGDGIAEGTVVGTAGR